MLKSKPIEQGQGGIPQTRMGVEQVIRDAFRAAQDYRLIDIKHMTGIPKPKERSYHQEET